MNLSQPAISARLAQLEDRVGQQLFTRERNGVRLTRHGEMFRDYAERIVTALEGMGRDLVPSDRLRGILRVGVAETIAQSWLTTMLRRLYDLYPAVSIEVSVDISPVLRDQLVNSAIDLAVLMGPISHPEVENVELPGFELGWYRAVGRAEVNLAEVPVITYGRGSRPYREMRSALISRHGAAIRLFPTTSLSAGFRMIVDDLGVGAFPVLLAREHVEAGRIAPFEAGWTPSALTFTASWRAEPGDGLAREAARVAEGCARAHYTEEV